ncbi:RmlC-like cupin [Polychaeton citri CBS 116435]|uniref:RmlC-like cupin n=1 Tax=Polychaeton citri CBS 116435 TaxID=1314669 RepID=A0A9P4Q7K9_9PEZI|nr:RmlC-like cupin [Polychaeton citri CBS 116435]
MHYGSITTFLVSSLACYVQAVDKTRDPSLNAQLSSATSQLDRLALLTSDDDWLFDFTEQQPYYNFAPGGVTNMNAATFSAAKGNGMTLAMLNLGPCAMLPPHYHPRASNYVVAVLGNTTTYMFEENGARLVTEVLTPGKATIFPQASMHMMQNNGCENAQLVSALNSEDAGTQNIANVFTNGFPSALVNAAFGQNLAGADTASKIVPVGTGSNWGDAECLARCGLHPNGTTRRF